MLWTHNLAEWNVCLPSFTSSLPTEWTCWQVWFGELFCLFGFHDDSLFRIYRLLCTIGVCKCVILYFANRPRMPFLPTDLYFGARKPLLKRFVWHFDKLIDWFYYLVKSRWTALFSLIIFICISTFHFIQEFVEQTFDIPTYFLDNHLGMIFGNFESPLLGQIHCLSILSFPYQFDFGYCKCGTNYRIAQIFSMIFHTNCVSIGFSRYPKDFRSSLPLADNHLNLADWKAVFHTERSLTGTL